MSSFGSGTVINYGSGSGSDFLTSYGSGSTSQKVTVPTVPVPVPAPYLDHKKQIFLKKSLKIFRLFTIKLFYKEKVHKFQ